MEAHALLKEVSEQTMAELFGPSERCRGMAAAEQAVVEFIKSKKPILEVGWEAIAPSFNTAKDRLSQAIGKVRFNPAKYGIMSREEFTKIVQGGGSRSSQNPLYDVGYKTLKDPNSKMLSMRNRLFIVHKESAALRSSTKDNDTTSAMDATNTK